MMDLDRERTTNRMGGNAKVLRKNMTPSEKRLWQVLRNKQTGFRFRRQAVIGEYIVDFACFTPKMIIELDGSQHLDSLSDPVRDVWFQTQGFKVLRFWNDAVLNDINSVVIAIQNELE